MLRLVICVSIPGCLIPLQSVFAATVMVHLRSCDGAPLPGVTVQVEGQRPMVTGADGTFRFEAAPRSATEVTAQLAGFIKFHDAIVACDAETTEIDLTLASHVIDDCIPVGGATLPRSHSLTGSVEDLSGKPIRDAVVRLSSSGRAVEIRTNRRGRFRTGELPNGEWTIEIRRKGYVTKTLPIWLAPCGLPCEGKPLRLRLSPECPVR